MRHVLGTDGGELCTKVPALLLWSCTELDKMLSFHSLNQKCPFINSNGDIN